MNRILRKSTIVLIASIIIHLLFLASLEYHFLDKYFNDASHRYGKGCDFFILPQSGQDYRDGHGLYQRRHPNRIVPYVYSVQNYHPAVGSSLGVLLSHLPAWTAYWLWVVKHELFMLLNIYLTFQITPNKRIFPYLASMWLVFTPYYLELFMGQFTYNIATAVMILTYLHVKTKWGSGLIWGLSLIGKPITITLLPVYLRERKFKTIIGAGILYLALTIPYYYELPGLEFKPLHMPYYKNLENQLLTPYRGQYSGHSGNFGFQLPLWIMSESDFVMKWFVRGVLIIGSLAVLFGGKDFTHNLAIMISSYFLTYRNVWEHHYVLMIPVMVLLANKYHKHTKTIIFLAAIYVWLAMPSIFVFLDTPNSGLRDPHVTWDKNTRITYHLFKVSAIIILYTWLVLTAINSQIQKQYKKTNHHKQ